MPDSNARIVRGLSIATVVISVLAILAVLAVAVLLAVLGSYMNDPAFVQRVIDEAYSQGSSVRGITANDVTMLVSLGIGTILAALVWSAICSALALVAGIVGIRNSSKQEKLGTAFGWAIAGAVMSFLTGRLITAVLLVCGRLPQQDAQRTPPSLTGSPTTPTANTEPTDTDSRRRDTDSRRFRTTRTGAAGDANRQARRPQRMSLPQRPPLQPPQSLQPLRRLRLLRIPSLPRPPRIRRKPKIPRSPKTY